MKDKVTLKKNILLPLIKAIIGVAVIVSSVLLCEQLRKYLADQTKLNNDWRDLIIAVLESSLAVLVYVLLFKFFEKRKIKELSWSTFPKNALSGFVLGLGLQTLTVLVLYIAGDYSAEHINPVSFLIPGFCETLI